MSVPSHSDTSFDKGWLLMQGYNREEAARHFEGVTSSDPHNAIAWWALAYCHGDDYNMYGKGYESLLRNDAWPSLGTARRCSVQAVEMADSTTSSSPSTSPPPYTSDVWFMLMNALAERFRHDDVPTQHSAYLAEIRKWNDWQNADCDALCVAAEAWMIQDPWNLWDRSTSPPSPRPAVEEVTRLLDIGLRKDPNHLWLCHLKVHVCEMGPPSQFDMSVLPPLEASTNGHLCHMPSHLYIQLGEYEKSVLLNRKAVDLDKEERRLHSRSPLTLYCFYECHNMHFALFAACMQGDKGVALEYARKLTAFVDRRIDEHGTDSVAYSMCEAFLMCEPMVMVRFGMWNEILDMDDSALLPSRMPSKVAFRHYARGVACAALGWEEEAHHFISAFQSSAPRCHSHKLHNESMENICNVATDVLVAEYLYRFERNSEHESRDWKAYLESAIRKEDSLAYDEPPAWMMPVRQTYGALLCEEGHTVHALKHFVDDLEKWPKNVWSTVGMARCLRHVSHDASRMQERTGITASCACATSHWDTKCCSSMAAISSPSLSSSPSSSIAGWALFTGAVTALAMGLRYRHPC